MGARLARVPIVALLARTPTVSLVALGVPTVLLAQSAPTGWATLSQRVDIEVASDGSARVRVDVVLGPAEEGGRLPLDEPVPFELLGFGEATAEEVVLGGEDRLVLWPTVGSHRAVRVEPPFDRTEGGGAALRLEITYTVDDTFEEPPAASGGEIHARIPVLTGPPVRAESGGAAFGARLSTPEEWALTEGFPSGLREVEPGRHEVALTVAPSVVGFRARADGVRRPGFPLVVDLLTVLILVGFAGFGWWHLRSLRS